MNNTFYSIEKNNKINYSIFYPNNYTDLPLLLYLHGAGERGANYEHVYRHGIPKLIKEGKEYDAVVLCPQCPAEFVWDNIVKELKDLIDSVVLKFRLKNDRICITGSSMGGFGTWMMTLTYPNLFAAAAPVCGGGMSWRAANLSTTPIKAYHGTADDMVPIIYSELMVEAVNRNGGAAELICLENFGHNDAIDEAYRNTDLTDWLLSKRKTNRQDVSEFLSELF